MKIIGLLWVFFVFSSVSFAHADQERPLKIESSLIRGGYELFAVAEMKKPLAKHIYLLIKYCGNELKIQDTKEFGQIVREIASKEDALEFVRLITSQELRPLLQDVYYTEVHKRSDLQKEGEDGKDSVPDLQKEGIEKIIPQQRGEEDVWFTIEPEQYDEWKLHEPIVTEEDDMYKIERFVTCYPQIKENKLTPAQLVKIWEWVDTNAAYKAEIQEVIAEGEVIQKILLFTK